jgi:hypothetical protein
MVAWLLPTGPGRQPSPPSLGAPPGRFLWPNGFVGGGRLLLGPAEDRSGRPRPGDCHHPRRLDMSGQSRQGLACGFGDPRRRVVPTCDEGRSTRHAAAPGQVSSATGLTSPTRSGVWPDLSTASSGARSLPTCRCRRRPGTNWCSTSRRPGRSASPFRRRCLSEPTW